MLDAPRRNSWHNSSLLMRGDGLLFDYLETPDSFQATLAGMVKEEINTKWQEFMAPSFENKWGICGRKYGRIGKSFSSRLNGGRLAIEAPFPELDEFLAAIGETGRRLREIVRPGGEFGL